MKRSAPAQTVIRTTRRLPPPSLRGLRFPANRPDCRVRRVRYIDYRSTPMNHIESLELRQLLAAVSLSHGVLRISGEASGTNSIAVDAGADGVVLVTVHAVRKNGTTLDLSKAFP